MRRRRCWLPRALWGPKVNKGTRDDFHDAPAESYSGSAGASGSGRRRGPGGRHTARPARDARELDSRRARRRDDRRPPARARQRERHDPALRPSDRRAGWPGREAPRQARHRGSGRQDCWHQRPVRQFRGAPLRLYVLVLPTIFAPHTGHFGRALPRAICLRTPSVINMPKNDVEMIAR